MNEYSISQLQSMQRQAQRRVEEMNARARRALESSAPLKSEQTVTNVKESKKSNSFPSGLLQSLNLQTLLGANSDQTLLVLVLILLLSDGNCDEILILAMLYLIF